MKQLLMTFSLFLFLVGISNNANAMSCWYPTPLEHVEKTSIIFYGKVLDGYGGPADDQERVVEFEVLRPYKGTTEETVKVGYFNDHGALRGWGFVPGQYTLVFADIDPTAEPGKLLPQVHYCSMIPYHGRPSLHAAYWDGLVAQAIVPDTPQFTDYKVGIYSGPIKAPDLSSHPDARTYRTRLRNAASGRINFAGEYILTTWGCGTTCIMGAVFSAKTGRVHFLPGTICCWFEMGENVEPIVFQADSNLMLINGLINEEEPMATHYFEFRNGNFHLL